MSVQQYVHADSVAQALDLLADPRRHAAVVAGGTALVRGKRRRVETLVDIGRCGLDRVEIMPDSIWLGAMVRAHSLVREPLPGAIGVLLAEAADGIATQPLRNVITVGGNLVRMVAWADLPVALLALDAVVEVRHRERETQLLSLAQLTAEHPRKMLPPGTLLTRVRIPRGGGGAGVTRGATYRRFRTSEVDYSLVSVAALVTLDGADRVAAAAVAVGAVTPRPRRCARGESLLLEQKPGAEVIAASARATAEELDVSPDFRLPVDLRQRILEVEIRRAISTAVARARGGAE
jgi:CO/xanthine dehydrogenase FAD-binding subunit